MDGFSRHSHFRIPATLPSLFVYLSLAVLVLTTTIMLLGCESGAGAWGRDDTNSLCQRGRVSVFPLGCNGASASFAPRTGFKFTRIVVRNHTNQIAHPSTTRPAMNNLLIHSSAVAVSVSARRIAVLSNSYSYQGTSRFFYSDGELPLPGPQNIPLLAGHACASVHRFGCCGLFPTRF